MNGRLRHPLLIGFAGLNVGVMITFNLHLADSSLRLAYFLPVLGLSSAAFLLFAWQFTSARLSRTSQTDKTTARMRAAWPFIAAAVIPIQYYPFLFYQNAGQEGVLRPLGPLWQLLLVLLFSAGLVFTLLAYQFPSLQRGPIAAAAARPRATLATIIVFWIILAAAMDVTKTSFLNEAGSNVPIFTDVLRHFSSDKGLLYSQLLGSNGSSLLGLHASFIWFLIYPLFRIWPSYQWLLIISDVALGLAAIPVYLLSRRFFGPGLCILLALTYLFNRAIFPQAAVGDLSEERFLPLLLISAVYFWQVARFRPFLLFALLAMMVREDVGLVIALLGVVSIFQRRGSKWWLVPIVFGSAWAVVMLFWFIPHFSANSTMRAVQGYSFLGDSASDIISTFVFRPWVPIKIAFSTARHIGTWFGLWQSFGFGLPLLSGTFILSILALVETMVHLRVGLNTFNILAIAAPLFPAFVLGLNKLEHFSRIRWKISLAVPLTLITLFSTASLAYSWFNPEWYQPRYNYDAAQTIIDQIPDNASAIMPSYLLQKAKPGQQVRGYHQATYEISENGYLDVEQDYIVLDQNMPPSWEETSLNEGLREIEAVVKSSPEFTMVQDLDDLQLYVRSHSPMT